MSRIVLTFRISIYMHLYISLFIHCKKRKASVSTLRISVTVRHRTSFHILTSFAQVDADIREDIISLLLLGNDVASAEALVADNVTLKSCSIDEMFV